MGENPFASSDPIVFLPAIRPDIAVFHASKADREGNVWIGRRRELVTMAHAAERTPVTVRAQRGPCGPGREGGGGIAALRRGGGPPARCPACMSKRSRRRRGVPGRCR